jgi:cold shock CspA family protein/ribosome-associated translation inhibitor RaiA
MSGDKMRTTGEMSMQIPLQIAIKDLEYTDAMDSRIRQKAERLDQFASDIIRCRVMLEPVAKHHIHQTLYKVRIDVTLPGKTISVTREPSMHWEHGEVHAAIGEAFDLTIRQLEDYVRRRRGHVKSHLGQPVGRVSRMVPDMDCGFLETFDGREVYFHRHSVLNNQFQSLHVGAEVTFLEEEGEKGPQASTVRVLRNHRNHESDDERMGDDRATSEE